MTTATVSTEHYPTARRLHTCCECRARIVVGEVYQRITGVWDGQGETFKTCMACWDARQFYTDACESASWRDSDQGEFTFCNLEEDLLEYAAEHTDGDGLKFGALRRVVQIRARRALAQ